MKKLIRARKELIEEEYDICSVSPIKVFEELYRQDMDANLTKLLKTGDDNKPIELYRTFLHNNTY